MDKARDYWLLLGLIVLGAGCVDGPLYALKKVNPYYRSQWDKDLQLGPTYEQRMAELNLLKEQLPAMSATQQTAWAERLATIVANDASPELRARAVLTMGAIQSQETVEALNIASGDDNEKVRLAACKAWKSQQGAAARDMLLSLAQRDSETTSVRKAAVDSLAAFDEAEVRTALGRLLDDSSPAIQFQVAQSLKTMSGRDYGGDLESWKHYLAGENIPEPPTESVAEELWNSLPSFR